jgi:hypothetical protein
MKERLKIIAPFLWIVMSFLLDMSDVADDAGKARVAILSFAIVFTAPIALFGVITLLNIPLPKHPRKKPKEKRGDTGPTRSG